VRRNPQTHERERNGDEIQTGAGALAARWLAKRYFQITLAISREGATLCPSVLDSLTIAWHGKSSGELQFSDDLKSD
jgi:hypothetical protein